MSEGTFVNFTDVETALGESPSLYLEYIVIYNAVTNYYRINTNQTPICYFWPQLGTSDCTLLIQNI